MIYNPFSQGSDEAPSGSVLATIDETGLAAGQIVYVATYGDYFSYRPYQVSPPTPNVIINGQRGQWIRLGIPNQTFLTAPAWSVNGTTGNDENQGWGTSQVIADASPLKTTAELARRMTANPIGIATALTAGLISAQNMVKLGYHSDLIDSQTISAVTTFTPAAWNAGQYREIQVVSRTTGGMIPGSTARITFNGDVTNNYDTLTHFTQGSLAISANSSFAAAAGQLALTGSASNVPDMLLTIRVFPLKVTSGHRPFTCEFHAEGTAAATFIMGTSRGFWLDTTNDMTFLTLTYGAAATGNVTVIGIPA